MKYKVYIAKTDEETKQVTFTEADFNPTMGFDTIEEANCSIHGYGYDYVVYVIHPFVFMTSY